MPIPLRVLVVKDSADDAELLLLEVRRAGYEPNAERVQSAATLEAALQRLRHAGRDVRGKAFQP